jgi:hypothetical protein
LYNWQAVQVWVVLIFATIEKGSAGSWSSRVVADSSALAENGSCMQSKLHYIGCIHFLYILFFSE